MSEGQIQVHATGPLLVTKSALAKALSVSQRTIDYWRVKGVIPCLELGPRFVRFNLAEVQATLERQYRLQSRQGIKAKLRFRK